MQNAGPTRDGGSIPTPSLQIQEISHAEAKPFIEKWHYSKKTPTGKNVFFGCFVDSELYAVADYGIGVNQEQERFLNNLLFGGKEIIKKARPAQVTNLYELKRLCRIEPRSGAVPLTKFLSLCHKMLKKKHGIRFIVSFSDPEHNEFVEKRQKVYESGGIYKAANFKHLGKTNAEVHVVDEDGNRLHRRVAYRYMQRENNRRAERLGLSDVSKLKGYAESQKAPRKGAGIKTSSEDEAMTLAEARQLLGLKRIKGRQKDRWFLDLGN